MPSGRRTAALATVAVAALVLTGRAMWDERQHPQQQEDVSFLSSGDDGSFLPSAPTDWATQSSSYYDCTNVADSKDCVLKANSPAKEAPYQPAGRFEELVALPARTPAAPYQPALDGPFEEPVAVMPVRTAEATGRPKDSWISTPVPPVLRPPSVRAGKPPMLDTYECGATKPLEYQKDPIVKIKIFIGISARDGDVRIFDVDHYAASGAVYSRQTQYYNRQFWATDDEIGWVGSSLKAPPQRMRGQLTRDNYRIEQRHYIEQRFVGGKLKSTTNSTCRLVQEESH